LLLTERAGFVKEEYFTAICHNFRDCSKSVGEQSYTTMVRPTLEYASAAWDPYTCDQINQLDKVQRRAARFVSNNYRDKTPGCHSDKVYEVIVIAYVGLCQTLWQYLEG
jgi:hypothetical protein